MTNAREVTIVKVKMLITVLLVRFIHTGCHTREHAQIYRKQTGIYIFFNNAKLSLVTQQRLFCYKKHNLYETILPLKMK